jgi:predicted lipoprotein with Yx(FWY)xxD motif/plastocyanin
MRLMHSRALLGFGLVVLALIIVSCAPLPAATSEPAATTAPPTMAPTADMSSMATPTVEPTRVVTSTIPAVGATGPAEVAVGVNDELGQFLVDAEGMTLYLFLRDTPGVTNCYDNCAVAWPPLYTMGPATAGEGVDAGLLGTTTRTDGTTQVTYNGWPLYYYAKDMQPGDVTGQDVGDVWYVISPAGEMVEAAEAAATAEPAATSTAAPVSQEVMVDAVDFKFDAKELTISAGTTVKWINKDAFLHTVTSDTGLFDGDLPASGGEFQFTFNEPGRYPYYCKPHGNPGGVGMAGVIIVQ